MAQLLFPKQLLFCVRVCRIFKVAAPVAVHRLTSSVHAKITSSMKMLTCFHHLGGVGIIEHLL